VCPTESARDDVADEKAGERRPRARRGFSRITIGFGVVAAVVTTGLVGEVVSRDAVPQRVTGEEPVTQQQIVATCGSCHDAPAPAILPRAAGRASFQRMAVIRSGQPRMVEDSAAGVAIDLPPEMRRVLEHYERMSPERLPAPERWPAVNASAFERRSMAAPQDFTGAPPTIANTRLVDLDGDGLLELLATDMRHGLVLRGRPYQRDSKLEVIASIPHPARISMADLEADGRPGFLVGDLGRLLPGDHRDGAVVWLRQTAGGGYAQQALEQWPRVADVRAGDFDGDGRLDLAVAAFGWRTVGRVAVLENGSSSDGRRVLREHTIDSRPGAIDVIPVDLNRDGKLDLVTLLAQHYETVIAYINKGTPPFTFDPVALYKAPHANWGSSGIDIVDLDADGDLDVLLTNGDSFDDAIVKPYHAIHWLENQGGLTFIAHRLAGMPGVHRAEAADLDGDGDLDVIASALLAGGSDREESQLPALIWLEQRKRGVFERRTLSVGSPRHATLDTGDFDRDGDIDIVAGVMSREGSTGTWIEVWENRRKAD
jgi:hypothetical protein